MAKRTYYIPSRDGILSLMSPEFKWFGGFAKISGQQGLRGQHRPSSRNVHSSRRRGQIRTQDKDDRAENRRLQLQRRYLPRRAQARLLLQSCPPLIRGTPRPRQCRHGLRLLYGHHLQSRQRHQLPSRRDCKLRLSAKKRHASPITSRQPLSLRSLGFPAPILPDSEIPSFHE